MLQSPYLVMWQELGSKPQPLWPWLERFSCRVFVEYLDWVTDAQPSSCLKTAELAQTEQTLCFQRITYAPALRPVRREQPHDLPPCFSVKLQKGDEVRYGLAVCALIDVRACVAVVSDEIIGTCKIGRCSCNVYAL